MKIKPLIAACAMSLSTGSNRLVVIPDGEFRGVDGRPFDAPAWRLTAANAETIIAKLSSLKIDLVIDYEHATLKALETGEPAPASGWLKPNGWEYIPGVGICSTQFEWTDKAKNFIESGEYKYLSPVLFYQENGDVIGLHSLALVNKPNLDTLPEAQLAAAAQDYITATIKDSSMDELLEQLRWMLNLPLSATAEEVLAELNKLSAQIKEKTGVVVAANGQNLFDVLSELQTKLAANAQTTPDPKQWVPMPVYQEALTARASIASNTQEKELEDAITAACSDGRLTGDATIAWVRERGKTDAAGTLTYLSELPKIAALTQQQTQQTKIVANHQQTAYSAEALEVAARMGVELPGANA